VTIDEGQLDSFGALAKALGILGADGNANGAWFTDPVGGGTSGRGLRNVLSNDGQRDALVAFVDGVLGPPDRAVHDHAVWVPLFRETTPQITIYAVVEPVPGAVHLGIGVEHATTGALPTVATRLHVPIFQLAREGSAPAGGGGLPDWLLIGRPGGQIDVTVDATFSAAAPPPGQAALGGLALTLGVPTAAGDDLAVHLALRDLQLPGAAAPRTFTLDADRLDELDTDVFELLVGLVRAQADAIDASNPTLRPFAALAGIFGLRAVTGLPPLPLAALPTAGISAVVDWIEAVLADNTARDAWLGELAGLLGAHLDAAHDAVTFDVGAAQVALGLRVEPGTSGHPVLTPRVEIGFDARAGARVRVAADLLRADTGTGAVTAFPDLRAEAIFGADAGGAALLTGAPHVGSLHLGLALTATRQPTFVLTLHDVDVAGHHHDVLDLSTPSAALDAVNDVIDGALTDALGALGLPGQLVTKLIGLDPPVGVTDLDATAILADPIGAIRGYWHALVTMPAAMAEVLGVLRRLIKGGAAAAAPGTGTDIDPWRIDFAEGIGLRFVADNVAGIGPRLVVRLAAGVATPVLQSFTAAATIAIKVLDVTFDPLAVTFAGEATGQIALRRSDGQRARLALGPLALGLDEIGLTARWSPATGFRAELAADTLHLEIDRPHAGAQLIELPLPQFDASHRLVFAAPDWGDIEAGLAALLGLLGLPVVDAGLRLIGWTGEGPHLALDQLFGGDPRVAVEAWLADLLLDCERLRIGLSPVAAVLSGFALRQPEGVGSERSPMRCPVAGVSAAPGLAAWLTPDCPPRVEDVIHPVSDLMGEVPAEPPALVGALAMAGRALPDVAELLVGRDGLAEGLALLGARWVGSDGVVGAPAAVPDGVRTPIVLPGTSYGELVAQGSAGLLLGDVLDPAPPAVVHVGCEATWIADRAAGTAFDLTTNPTAAVALSAAGNGTFFVRLPTPAAAATARPDRGGVGEQAARLADLLRARTAPITVVGYGACGAAAVRAAGQIAAVSDVVTVGTPWAGLAIDALRSGQSGDALVLLGRLLRPDASLWADPVFALEASPLQVTRELVKRALALVADPSALPSAEGEPRRAGLAISAVFGSLAAEEIAAGLAAYVADGIDARSEAAVEAAGAELPHTQLHLGVHLPAFDLDLGGLLVGAGATVELAGVDRTAGGGIAVHGARALLLDLHVGVHDGWLVGGPGAASREIEARWLSAHLRIPFGGGAGASEIVLHEARAFAAYRERWVIRADGDGVAATVALPEVKVILSAVVARLRAASPELGALLEIAGVARAGGLDPEGLDRLLFDTGATLRNARATAAPAIAAALRALIPAATGTGAALGWQIGPATLQIDLAARTFSAALAASTLAAGLPPLQATVTASPAGADLAVALGALDATAGGFRLLGRAGANNDLALEWQAPAGAIRRIPLLPAPAASDLAALESLLTVLVPAAVAHGVATFCRGRLSVAGRAAFEAVFDAVGLLGPADDRGVRPLLHPIGLFDDPAAWLRGGVARWRTDLAGSAIALLDGLRPIVAPTAPAGQWSLTDGVAVRYGVDAGQLSLALEVEIEVTVDGRIIATQLLAGVNVGAAGAPSPRLEAGVTIDGQGLRLAIAPHVRLLLERPTPAVPLELFPSGPGLGSVLTAAGETILPPVLNALAARRSDAAASIIKDVGAALFDLGGALELLEANQFTSARVTSFAADPAARLLARLPNVAATAVATLAHALDPAAAKVKVTQVGARVTLGFGTHDSFSVTLDGQAATPAIELGASVSLPGVGRVVLERLRLSAAGVEVLAQLGPASVAAGPVALHPLLVVRAGGAAATRMLGLGLALDAAATSTVQFRWTLDERPPVLVATGAGGVEDSSPEAIAIALLGHAASLGMGVLVAELGPSLTTLAKDLLRGVVFSDEAASTTLDPTLISQLFSQPERLLGRLERLLWNAASQSLAVTIGGVVTIGLVGEGPADGPKQLGLRLSLPAGQRLALATGDPTVAIEVDASWVEPAVAPGISIYVVEGRHVGDAYTFRFAPGVVVAGVGLRFSKTAGPLLDLGGLSLDAIGLHLYGEASAAGFGGGARLQLDGLAVSPAGAGGDNAVANGIVSDAGASGAANRPSFSPSFAVQIHPGQSGPSVSLRAGDPPGPWWILVQRQLGPLYLERVGFDTVEQGGRLTRISLLFDGRVSLFGLTASVDQLSLSWLGGDVLAVTSWAVDLQGLAVAADMAGVSLSGGLLKTTHEGQISYVGMLMGRFGIYGLSVFGGYTDDHGSPSFFVFGALNGPIGGPPAFFVTGIGGGLGINRGLRVPDDLSRFNEYPFIKALDPAAHPPADPMGELRRLNDYFPPVRGNFWFAAGISFTCFALVDGIAVLSVSFGDGLDINLLGLARMALPRPGAALVSIELGLLARFSTREGLFSIRAQLTDNSWLLYEDVRLTGGFAFVVWWKGSNRGQFVLSLGGYHPSFHRDGYPDVPRLGLVWHISSEIVVKGESYFALTSEALMAGVGVEVSADFGWAWVRIAFGADGIVYFDPFWFEVSAYARIAAGIKIKTFFGTIRFGISIGASIRVWGPEFSGEATFSVGPASISVGFGSERAIEKVVLPWDQFVGKYLEDAGGSARALSAISGRGSLPSATGGQKSSPPADGSPAKPFEVFAEFELTVTTTIPTKAFDLGLTGGPRPVAVKRSDGALAELGLAPMRAGQLSSTVVLSLEQKSGASYAPVPDKLRALGANLVAASPTVDGSSIGTDAFPIGAWGPPDDNSEPTLPKGDVLFAGNSVRLVAEAAGFTEGPQIDYYRVEASRRPLPLQAGGATRPDLITRADAITGGLVKPATAQAALVAAQGELFRDTTTTPPAGVLARGPRSNVARAAFVGERVAPPLFGTLGDGLRPMNAAAVPASKQAMPPPVTFTGVRAPVVTALLTAGAGVAARAPQTTVANQKIKRRIAPSVASVQARFELHLPITMITAPFPATTAGGTVIATGTLPRTEAPGATRSYRAGTTGGLRGLDGLVGGLARGSRAVRARASAAALAGSVLAPGDVVVLRLPDSAVDVDVKARPLLRIEGRARVTLVRGEGTVTRDDLVEGDVSIPPGIAQIAVQAGAVDESAAASAGLIGWHGKSRLAALSAHAALGPACVLALEGGTAAATVGWSPAAEIVAGVAAVITRFARPVRSVVIVLADGDPERFDSAALELGGATRALGKDGAVRAPTVVLKGGEAAVIYAVVPTGAGPVTVRVTAGGNWRLGGVLGGDADPAQLAKVILDRGIVAAAARALAAAGEGCRVTWKTGGG
jgi:hypothetical protein